MRKVWRWNVEGAIVYPASAEIHRIRKNPPFHVTRYDEHVRGGEGGAAANITYWRVCGSARKERPRLEEWKEWGRGKEERKEEKSTRIFRSAATYSPFVDRTAIIPYCSSNSQLLTLTLTPSFRPSPPPAPPPTPDFPARSSSSLSLCLSDLLFRANSHLSLSSSSTSAGECRHRRGSVFED